MTTRILAVIAAAVLLATPGASTAQSSNGDVTFEIPLNLTQLSSTLEKVLISCNITSDAITEKVRAKSGLESYGRLSKEIELPVTGGQLVTTARVTIAATDLDNPTGKSAAYRCVILGFNKSLQGWDVFSETHATAALRLTPTPQVWTGSFVW